eukprot:m.3372 g.3372  ORF g.3372 m.3372 type:complete len:596 (+) comp9316_c0_seq1:400-2187(+)
MDIGTTTGGKAKADVPNTTPQTIKFDESKLRFVRRLPLSLQCCVCQEMLADPVQTSCGQRMCQACFKDLFKNISDKKQKQVECPSCGEVIDGGQSWRDVFADKELDLLDLYCVYEPGGCEWIGARKKLKEHMSACEHLPVNCSKQGCDAIVPKLKLKYHEEVECLYRVISCRNCKTEVLFLENNDHGEVCPKAPVTCPNLCEMESGGVMLREDLASHLQTCPRRKRQCSILGCLFEGTQDEVRRHESDSEAASLADHIRSVSLGCKEVKREVDKLHESVDEKHHDFRSLQQGSQKAVEALAERTGALETEVVDMQAHQKVVQAKIVETCYQSVDNAQKEYLGKFANLEQHFRMFTEKMLKMEETVTSQASRIKSLEEELQAYKKSDSGRGTISGTGVATPLFEQQFSQQDRILATHDVKLAEHGLRIDMLDCKNAEGVLLWKITEVRRRRREAVSGKTPSIYSQPFYTTLCGYKLCARLYLNGDGMGKGSHLSLFFVVMRGEYDALLSWPFQHKVTLVLIDQDDRRNVSDTFRPDPNSSSFKRPRNEMNIASGCPLFVPLPTLDNGSYIRDDTMFIKIVADTAGVVKPDGRNQLL